MEAINLCDQPGCSEAATHSYTWEWGASGTCCAKHQQTMQQTSVSLARGIQFGLLTAAATAPLQREERVRLKAESLVLAEELSEAKARGLDMYRQLTMLTQQVQSLTMREREAVAQKKDALAARDEMDRRLRELEAENSNIADELARTRVLLPYDETQPGVGPSPSS